MHRACAGRSAAGGRHSSSSHVSRVAGPGCSTLTKHASLGLGRLRNKTAHLDPSSGWSTAASLIVASLSDRPTLPTNVLACCVESTAYACMPPSKEINLQSQDDSSSKCNSTPDSNHMASRLWAELPLFVIVFTLPTTTGPLRCIQPCAS